MVPPRLVPSVKTASIGHGPPAAPGGCRRLCSPRQEPPRGRRPFSCGDDAPAAPQAEAARPGIGSLFAQVGCRGRPLHRGVAPPPPSERTTHRWNMLRCPASADGSPTSRAASSAESAATITRTPCAVSAASTPPASSVDTHAGTPLARNMPAISSASARLPTTAAVTSRPMSRVCIRRSCAHRHRRPMPVWFGYRHLAVSPSRPVRTVR